MLSHDNELESLCLKKTNFLTFFDGVYTAGEKIVQSSSIADLKSLQATCTAVNHFLIPQRVNRLKDLELEVRSVIEKN